MLVRRGAALIIVAAIASAVVAAMAYGSGGPSTTESDATASFRIFSHPATGLVRAVSQQARLNPPPGAILAESNARSEIYALQKAGAEKVGSHVLGERLCVIDLQPGEGGEACGSAQEVAKEGVSLVNMPVGGATLSVAGLVPNGVESVTATDLNGASTSVPVKNNTFTVEDDNLASVTYLLPGGKTESVNVKALVERQTGKP